jgi:hypothetical protein
MIGKGGMKVIYKRLVELEEQICPPGNYDLAGTVYSDVLQRTISNFSTSA